MEIRNEIISNINVYVAKGDIAAAFDYLARTCSNTPDYSYLVALLYKRVNKIDLAIQELQSSETDTVHRNVLLAELLEPRGLIDESIKMWQRSDDELSNDQYSSMLQAMLKSPSLSSNDLLIAHIKWADKFCPASTLTRKNSCIQYDGARKVVIGYHCSFWNSFTMKHQLLPLLKYHDRNKFTINLYSPHPLEACFVPYADNIRVVGGYSDEQFLHTVGNDKVDILVECTGFSPGHRFTALAKGCAPIQISYLNHAGTSGVPNVDYIFADGFALNTDEDKFFTERIYRLPGSFFCFNFEDFPHPDPSELPALKNGYITFGCFGSHGKINPVVLSWWAKILKAVPDSRIYIRNNELSQPDNQSYLQTQFLRLGIASDRLIIRGGAHRNEIINCYADVDISLDTWPYNGGNTIAESLWQGVPVVSYRGKRFAESYGASLLMTSGCPELIAKSPDEYINLAARLAENNNLLADYRHNLRARTRQYGFNNASDFAKKIEHAYLNMVEDKCAESNKAFSSVRDLQLGLRGLGFNMDSTASDSSEKWLFRHIKTLLRNSPKPIIIYIDDEKPEINNNLALVSSEPILYRLHALSSNLIDELCSAKNISVVDLLAVTIIDDKTECLYGATNMLRKHSIKYIYINNISRSQLDSNWILKSAGYLMEEYIFFRILSDDLVQISKNDFSVLCENQKILAVSYSELNKVNELLYQTRQFRKLWHQTESSRP
ncbi:MAG: hypothetical protein WCK54_17645 [Desulfuromonadales bacterium]